MHQNVRNVHECVPNVLIVPKSTVSNQMYFMYQNLPPVPKCTKYTQMNPNVPT